MKKIPRLLFIALYALLGMYIVLEIFRFFDVNIGPVVEIPVYPCWILLCFSSFRWMPGVALSFMRVRKTILEEEEWLHPLMHELNLRSGIEPRPNLLVLEQPEMNAFATGRNTIVVSRGLLVKLSELEIKAVLAHEYGHLKSGDTFMASAFELAAKPLLWLYMLTRIIFERIKKRPKRKRDSRIRLILILLIAAGIWIHPTLIISFLLILYIFMKVLPLFSLVVRAIWCSFSRSDEFKQDSFAQSLGCGKYLKSALLKIDALNSNSLVNRITQFWLTHPMLYARVRRLEWLEGLRPTP